MVLDLYNSHRETRDNLGNKDENKNLILLGPYIESAGIEMGPTIATITGIGNAFILGHANNGIIGTQRLGATDYGNAAVSRVVNPNNVFHEHFRYSNFNDSDNTTGSYDTTNFNVSMTLNQQYQTLDIFKNSERVFYVTCFIDAVGPNTFITVDDRGGQTVTLTEGS